MRSRKNTVAVISHEEDIDGLASATLLLRFYRESSIILTNYHKMKWVHAVRKVHDLCRSYKNLELFISDLNLKPWMLEKLDKGLEECSEKKVYWIDHHVWDEESLRLVEKLGYVKTYGDREHTSTELVARFLGVHDEVVEILSELSRDSDYGLFKNPLTEPLTDLIRYIVYIMKRKSKLLKIVRKFSRGIIWDSSMDFTWESAIRYKARALEKARENLFQTEIKGCKILFIFSDPILSSKILLERIGAGIEYDIAFTIYSNGSITISRKNNLIDCSSIARRLGGGGHMYIAGAQISSRIVRDRDRVLREILSKIQEAIPRCR
ncbi:MAG: hypothetical protein QW366_04130 [Sulfolobales archaeon]